MEPSFVVFFCPFRQLILRQIDAVDKKADALAGGGTLTVKCKDLSVVRLDVATTEELHNVAASLESLSSIGEPRPLRHPPDSVPRVFF